MSQFGSIRGKWSERIHVHNGSEDVGVLSPQVARRNQSCRVELIGDQDEVEIPPGVFEPRVRCEVSSELFLAIRTDTPLRADESTALLAIDHRNIYLECLFVSTLGVTLEQRV